MIFSLFVYILLFELKLITDILEGVVVGVVVENKFGCTLHSFVE